MSRIIGNFALTKTSLGALFWRFVPEALFLPGVFLPTAKILRLETWSSDSRFDTALQNSAQDRQSVAVQIAKAACLLRSVSLPKAAMARAEAAIALHIRQTMPAAGKGLIWRSVYVGQKDAIAEFNVYFIKQSQLDSLLTVAKSHGVALAEVNIEGSEALPLWNRDAKRRTRRKFWLIATLCALLFLSIWAIVTIEGQVSEIERRVTEASQRIATSEETLLAARDQANKAQAEAATFEQDLSLFNAQTGRLALLADLTEALSDNVWISELTITGDQMSMSGFVDGDIAETVTTLQSLDWAKSVQLEGPVSFDSYTGQNRFQLRIRLRAKDEPL